MKNLIRLAQELAEEIAQLDQSKAEYKPMSDFPQTTYMPAYEISIGATGGIKPVNPNSRFLGEELSSYSSDMEVIGKFENGINPMRLRQIKALLRLMNESPFDSLPLGGFEFVSSFKYRTPSNELRQYLRRVHVNGRNSGKMTHAVVIWHDITDMGLASTQKIIMHGPHQDLFKIRMKELMQLETDIDVLTAKEAIVLALVRKGLSTSEIAQKLHRSSYTISTHRKNICKKLGVKDLRLYLSSHSLQEVKGTK